MVTKKDVKVVSLRKRMMEKRGDVPISFKCNTSL